jgi:two-component system sensor histidine kinase PhcS
MQISSEILAAYRDHDREMTIRKTRVGCILGLLLYPMFNILDHLVYPELAPRFLALRLVVSALMALLYPLFGTQLGRKFYRLHGIILLTLPSIGIAWMIYEADGAASTYYAGLTFVLMFLAVVLDWTFVQSLAAVAIVIMLYMTSVLSSPIPDTARALFYNNLVFLSFTGVVIIAGTYFHSALRLSEFASRFELDQSRRALASQNNVLQSTLKQLKETESQLVQTEKIVSLGRLSAGLIHEINNPLNFAATGLYVLRNQGERLAKENPSEFSEVVQDIDEGVKRVKNIVSDLRSFTHPDADHRESIKVADVSTAALRFLGSEWKDRVRIESEVPPEILCWANKNKLTQVFVNLLQNALDALKKRPPGAEEPVIRIAGRHENGRVFITVRDNGEGIDPQNLSKIFDPFFTTREIGQGMGMGLSICFRIIQEHGGSISVNSERGKFCEFTIELPATHGESVAA